MHIIGLDAVRSDTHCQEDTGVLLSSHSTIINGGNLRPMEPTVLETFAAISEIATALVAVGAYGEYQWDRRDRVGKLDAYMRSQPDAVDVLHAIPLMNVMTRLKLTEEQAVSAAFQSKIVKVVWTTAHATPASSWSLILG